MPPQQQAQGSCGGGREMRVRGRDRTAAHRRIPRERGVEGGAPDAGAGNRRVQGQSSSFIRGSNAAVAVAWQHTPRSARVRCSSAVASMLATRVGSALLAAATV